MFLLTQDDRISGDDLSYQDTSLATYSPSSDAESANISTARIRFRGPALTVFLWNPATALTSF